MNQHPEEVRCFLLEADFQFRGNVMHARQWKRVGHGAMAGNIEPPTNPFDLDIMHIQDLRKVRGGGF